MLIAAIGHSLLSRFTQVHTLSTQSPPHSHPDRRPCLSRHPPISISPTSWEQKPTSSMRSPTIRHSLPSRFPQDRTLNPQLMNEGARQPFGLRGLSNVGLR